MTSAAIPPPVVFDLDVAENARLRDSFIVASGARMSLYLVAFSVLLQFVPPILRLYRYRGNDPFDWALLVVVSLFAVVVLAAIADPERLQRLFLRPQVGTSVAFDEAALVVERGSTSRRSKRRVAFAKIRSVQMTPDSLVIMGRFQPIILIPKRALPDGGERIMSFFEDRLVAKGRLFRAVAGRTTIVNTVSP